jgi:hypothetical protein
VNTFQLRHNTTEFDCTITLDVTESPWFFLAVINVSGACTCHLNTLATLSKCACFETVHATGATLEEAFTGAGIQLQMWLSIAQARAQASHPTAKRALHLVGTI